MPYHLHRPEIGAPSVLTESDVCRILNKDLPNKQMQESAWKRLNAGERIFVKGGFLTWERTTE